MDQNELQTKYDDDAARDAVEDHLKDYESLMKYALKLLDDNKSLMEENLSLKRENQEILQGNILMITENDKLKAEKEKLIDDSLVLIDYNDSLKEEKNNLEKELIDIKNKFDLILNTLSLNGEDGQSIGNIWCKVKNQSEKKNYQKSIDFLDQMHILENSSECRFIFNISIIACIFRQTPGI